MTYSYDNQKLTKEEQVIENEIETYISIDSPLTRKTYAESAKESLKKMTKRKAISIRVFEQDLIKIKTEAQKLGIPYQTLITSELHKRFQ